MEGFIWPAWVQAIAGLIGVSCALSSIARAQVRGWRSPSDRFWTIGLIVFGCALAAIGVTRWIAA